MWETVNGVEGSHISEPKEVMRRGKEYFQDLLNVRDGREAVASCLVN